VTGAPVASLVMGVHDGAAYLREAVDSVLAQTMAEVELVVVDDASRDATPEILAAYDDPRLVVLRNAENLGLTRSLNRGLAAARGRYVGRHDADDRSVPERLERQVAFLEAHPGVGLCGTWARLIDRDGRVTGTGHPPSEPDALAAALLVENKLYHGSFLGRRALWDALGGYREAFRYSQDYDLLLRALDAHRVANVPEELYEMRFHDTTITGTRQEAQQRFRSLALRLALERRARGGRDALDDGVPVERLLEAVAADGDGAEFWRVRAMYRRLSGDLRGSRRALVEVIRREPRDARAYLHLLVSLGGPRAAGAADRAWVALQARRGAPRYPRSGHGP
jgi:glycosyltransferase involved in cell wall biosynthesis